MKSLAGYVACALASYLDVFGGYNFLTIDLSRYRCEGRRDDVLEQDNRIKVLEEVLADYVVKFGFTNLARNVFVLPLKVNNVREQAAASQGARVSARTCPQLDIPDGGLVSLRQRSSACPKS